MHGQAQSSYHSYRFVCELYTGTVTQFCITMPPPPHHTGSAHVPVILVPSRSGFAAWGPFPCPWLDRKAPRSRSYCCVTLCQQNHSKKYTTLFAYPFCSICLDCRGISLARLIHPEAEFPSVVHFWYYFKGLVKGWDDLLMDLTSS